MNLNIRVIPRASRNLVREEKQGLKVYLTKPAQDGLANSQLIELLADHFQVKRRQIVIIKGERSRNKLVRINAAARDS